MTAKALDIYKSKRDFSRTAEPAGDTAIRLSDKLHFVIQKHAARRLHYDLRLELDGVFKSWAVTRGPSLDPADKRLAVEVEDHPLEYGDFEGTIPAGEYGGGTVQLWDRGYWQPITDKSPRQSLKSGELKFKLYGERLQGEWVLVKMHNDRGDKRNNWLLIKHREAHAKNGNDAKAQAHLHKQAEALLALDESIASGRTMAQIAKKTGRAPTPFMQKAQHNGHARSHAPQEVETRTKVSTAKNKHVATKPAAGTLLNKLSKALKSKRTKMPEFIEPELCKLVSSTPRGEQWLHEMKLDGYRLQARVVDGEASVKTRKGLDWSGKFPSVVAAMRALPDCIVDGELVALDKQQQPNFSALQAALAAEDTDKLVYFIFDLLFLVGHDLRDRPLLARKQLLQALLEKYPNDSLRYVDHLIGSGEEMWRAACDAQMEGIISKRGDSVYSSSRSGAWTKTKCRAGHEVVIGGMTTDGAQLRSLLVGVMRNRQLIYVGRVGTGFSADKSRVVMPRLKKLSRKQCPFHGATAPRQEVNVTWIKPALVAEIEFAGWTDGGMVRQAAFKGLRDDKPAAEVQAETAVDIDDAVNTTSPKRLARSAKHKAESKRPIKHVVTKATKKTATKTRATRTQDTTAMISGVTITHASKELWPAAKDDALTKLDLAEYFVAMSKWMLPHLQGRPCSIVRAPDGIAGETFFQRHAMAGSPDQLQTIKLNGDRKPYLQIDTVDSLVAIAQLGGIELHPGNGIPDYPEIPGRLVFDLDPAPDVDFKRVIQAALELRERLEALGMPSFCKTSGGKGLHVVTPLNSKQSSKRSAKGSDDVSWKTAKLFAQTVCAQMVSDNPDKYLITISKAARKGKIFLDYLRNDRLATAVAPLSPRARPQAPVSMPLEWKQVKTGLDPLRYTLSTAVASLAKSAAWADYFDAERSLSKAVHKLLK